MSEKINDVLILAGYLESGLSLSHTAAAMLRLLNEENERLRGLVRHILGDRITPEAYLLFGKAWVDEAHAALRREDKR